MLKLRIATFAILLIVAVTVGCTVDSSSTDQAGVIETAVASGLETALAGNVEPTATAAPAATSTPEPVPTGTPTPEPTVVPPPTPEPTATSVPSATPLPPTATPTPAPTSTPTPAPTSTPTPAPTSTPTPAPTSTPTPAPTSTPTIVGTVKFQVDVQEVTTASQLGMGSVVGPSLIRLKDGRYRLYLQAREIGLQGKDQVVGIDIISLISTDGIQWDAEQGIRIQHGSPTDVDFEAGEPGVYLGLDNRYYMAYTGRQMGVNKRGDSQLMHRVVFAVSDDGLNWAKLNQYYADPQNINDFASSADVNVVNGRYVIYYTGQRNIIRATSQDGLTWVRQEVTFSAGHDSTMVKYDGTYYMFAKMPEALAYARNPDTRLDLLVMAISRDGVNWSNNYYQVVVENADGSEVTAENLQDPSAILVLDGSLRIFLNNDRGEGIYSIKPVSTLPKLAPDLVGD